MAAKSEPTLAEFSRPIYKKTKESNFDKKKIWSDSVKHKKLSLAELAGDYPVGIIIILGTHSSLGGGLHENGTPNCRIIVSF